MPPEPFPLVELAPGPFCLAGLVDERLARQSWQPLEPVSEAEREEREAEFRIKQARWKAQRAEAEAFKERVKPMAQVMRDLEPILRERREREIIEFNERTDEERRQRSRGTVGAAGQRNTRVIPQDVKIEVAVRDGGRCRQCGSNKELHFDHVIPWSKGGPNTLGNIQLLCGTCNRRKGADDIPADLPPSPYRQAWRSPATDTRPPQAAATYKSPPPLSYLSEREKEPTCPVCGMLSALHTGASCRGNREDHKGTF